MHEVPSRRREPTTPAVHAVARPDVLAWADALAHRVARDHDYQHVAVLVLDESASGLRILSQRWRAGEDMGVVLPGEWLVPLDGSICGRVAQTGQPALCGDVRLDPDYRSYPGATGRSELAVPIVVDGKAIGVINLESPQVSAYGIDDLDRLLAVAAEAAVAWPVAGPSAA